MNFSIKGLTNNPYFGANPVRKEPNKSIQKEETASTIMPGQVNNTAGKGVARGDISKLNIPVQTQGNIYNNNSVKDTIRILQSKFGIIE